MLSRRHFLTGTAALAGGAAVLKTLSATPQDGNAATLPTPPPADRAWPPGQPGGDYQPVVVPNGTTLPWKLVDGVKVYHLTAGEVDHEFAPGLRAKCWGYNGQVHGPLIEAVDGDRVRIYVTNQLAAATSVHWHGVLLPNGMDGVGGLNQKAIQPGETFKYEFTLRQAGTAMYHSHHDEMTQIALGMTGLFVIHPRPGKDYGGESGPLPKVDRDFALMLHEWRIDPGTSRPVASEMIDFNVLSINGKVFPATQPLLARKGDRVRIRLGNLSPMEHHPIHLHGHDFIVTETGGGRIPPSAQHPEATVLVPVGSTRTLEFVADAPGDWAFHCHMIHHVMNQMGHGAPNMIGVQPGKLDDQLRGKSGLGGYMAMGARGMADMGSMGMKMPGNSIAMEGGQGPYDIITMGGMFSIFKVRENLVDYAQDPGWYEAPAGTVAARALPADLARDGITLADPVPAVAAPTAAAAPDQASGARRYTCVMHPEVVLDHTGKCPKCGMALVAQK